MTFTKQAIRLFLPNIREVFSRFLVPALCVVLFGIFALTKNHNSNIISYGSFAVVLGILFFGIIFFLSLKLISESHHWPIKKYLMVTLPIFWIVALYLIFSGNFLLHLVFLSAGVGLLLMAAPFVNQSSEDSSFCYFNCTMGVNFGFSVLAALILCAGISASLASIDYLFKINMPSKLYADVWIIGWSIFAPFYALAGIPKNFSLTKDEGDYPTGVKFIVMYILVPLMYIYFLILYIYSLKILIQWDLPRGNLAYMITTFGIIGIVTHMFANPLHQTGHKMLDIFYRCFYPALLAPIVLLVIGIGIRIHEYGVTENRYAVLIATIWFTITVLYFTFSKTPRIKMPSIFLSILFILTSFGPWGAVTTSTNSQLARLEPLLIQHSILVNEKIIPTEKEIPFDDANTISSIVDYLIEYRKAKTIEPWFSEIKDANVHKKRRYNSARQIVEEMGVEYISPSQRKSSRFNFRRDEGSLGWNERVLNIAGFTYAIKSGYIYIDKNGKWSKKLHNDSGEFIFQLSNGVLTVTHPDKTIIVFDLNQVIRSLQASNISGNVPKEKHSLMTLDVSNGPVSNRLYLEKINGAEKNGKFNISSLRFLILL